MTGHFAAGLAHHRRGCVTAGKTPRELAKVTQEGWASHLPGLVPVMACSDDGRHRSSGVWVACSSASVDQLGPSPTPRRQLPRLSDVDPRPNTLPSPNSMIPATIIGAPVVVPNRVSLIHSARVASDGSREPPTSVWLGYAERQETCRPPPSQGTGQRRGQSVTRTRCASRRSHPPCRHADGRRESKRES